MISLDKVKHLAMVELSKQRTGCRFDIHVEGMRVFELLAESPEECSKWVKIIGHSRVIKRQSLRPLAAESEVCHSLCPARACVCQRNRVVKENGREGWCVRV